MKNNLGDLVFWAGYVAKVGHKVITKEKQGPSVAVHWGKGWDPGAYPFSTIERLMQNNQPFRNDDALTAYNVAAYKLLDDPEVNSSVPNSSVQNTSPFGPLIRHLYALKELQGRQALLPRLRRQDLSVLSCSERLFYAWDLWYQRTTFVWPNNGVDLAAAVIGPGQEVEKEPAGSPFAPNTHFGFARLSTSVKTKRADGFAEFKKSLAQVTTVDKRHNTTRQSYERFQGHAKDANKAGGTNKKRNTDEIEAFLDSKLYAESYEKAAFAASLGTRVHQQLLLKAMADDTQFLWRLDGDMYRPVLPRRHLVQTIFDGAVPRDIFESVVPVAAKFSPLDAAVQRMQECLWRLVKSGFPTWRHVAVEYEVLCPWAVFYTGSGKPQKSAPQQRIAPQGWRFLKTRIDAVLFDEAENEIIVADYKCRIGDAAQDSIGDVEHVLQVVLNAYLFACCTRLVPAKCAVLYGNRNETAHALVFPFQSELRPGTFVHAALQILFQALPGLACTRDYAFETGAGTSNNAQNSCWDVFDIATVMSLPALRNMLHWENAGLDVRTVGLLGPEMRPVDKHTGNGRGPVDKQTFLAYSSIPEYALDCATHTKQKDKRVYIWRNKNARGDPMSLPVLHDGPERGLLAGFPKDARKYTRSELQKAAKGKIGKSGKSPDETKRTDSNKKKSITIKTSINKASTTKTPKRTTPKRAKTTARSVRNVKSHESSESDEDFEFNVVLFDTEDSISLQRHKDPEMQSHKDPEKPSPNHAEKQSPNHALAGPRTRSKSRKRRYATSKDDRKESGKHRKRPKSHVSTVGVVNGPEPYCPNGSKKSDHPSTFHSGKSKKSEHDSKSTSRSDKSKKRKHVSKPTSHSGKSKERKHTPKHTSHSDKSKKSEHHSKSYYIFNTLEYEMMRAAEQDALDKRVKEMGEQIIFHPVVAKRTAVWLQRVVSEIAGDVGPSDISQPLKKARSIPENARKTEAFIRGMNRLLNKRILQTLKKMGKNDKTKKLLLPPSKLATTMHQKPDSSSVEKTGTGQKGSTNILKSQSLKPIIPKPSVFPHLSQRDFWSLELLQYAKRLLPEVEKELVLGFEKAHF